MPNKISVAVRSVGTTATERRRERIEKSAVLLLEKVMRRSRWTSGEKDRVADHLERLVVDELKRKEGLQ